MKFTQAGNLSQGRHLPHELSLRLAEIRRESYGDRGRSSFARDLNVPVTSYIHYETDRVPPADLLVRAARLTGTRLEWLLCGTGERSSKLSPEEDRAHGIAHNLLELLRASPEFIPSAEEFLQLLSRQNHSAKVPLSAWPSTVGSTDSLIPVVGSTAAGLARFWNELEANVGGPAADARLEDLLEAYGQQAVAQPGQAISAASQEAETIALVQFSQPDEQGLLEFLDASRIKARYPDAIAWRIDGDSMSPRYQDRDFVITSPQYPAIEMHPCVARQRGQIGVNCKLFQTRGDEVLLIPIQEASKIQRLHRDQLHWAWRVLASVRLQSASQVSND